VVQFVLFTAQLGDFTEGFEWSVRLNVHGHRVFTDGDRPNVEIVNVNDVLVTFSIQIPDVFSKCHHVEIDWRALHNDQDALLNDRESGAHNKDRKQESANWVSDPSSRVKVDDGGCDRYTDRL